MFEENRSLESVRFLHLSQIRLEVRAEWDEMLWGWQWGETVFSADPL